MPEDRRVDMKLAPGRPCFLPDGSATQALVKARLAWRGRRDVKARPHGGDGSARLSERSVAAMQSDLRRSGA